MVGHTAVAEDYSVMLTAGSILRAPAPLRG